MNTGRSISIRVSCPEYTRSSRSAKPFWISIVENAKQCRARSNMEYLDSNFIPCPLTPPVDRKGAKRDDGNDQRQRHKHPVR